MLPAARAGRERLFIFMFMFVVLVLGEAWSKYAIAKSACVSNWVEVAVNLVAFYNAVENQQLATGAATIFL